ncbi:MAG TPA: glycosyltransferase family 4 protein [bacterium]|nr:glycosyltransferase family 4 protein [bacterium]
MTKKNIIVSTHDSLAPIFGGGALRTLKAAVELKHRGHNVIIIAPTDKIGELRGIKTHWLHSPKKQRSAILSSLKFNIRLLRKFLQFIFQTDLFFIHNTIAALFIPFLKFIFPIKFVLDITDIHAEYLPIAKRTLFEKLMTPILLKLEYFIINSADLIIVESNAMKNLLISKKISAAKINVVYDGAELDEIPNNKTEDYFFNIIHLGAVDKQHGVDIIVKAIPEVIKKIENARFYFVGGGRELNNIKKLADTLNISKYCVFTDYLECNKARDYLRRCSIGIIPRRKNLPNDIVTTLKIFEYWASRTAVIATRLQAISEISKEEEDIIFFESDNYIELSQKIIYLLQNPEKLKKIAANGYNKVQQFNWANIIKQIADYTEKV